MPNNIPNSTDYVHPNEPNLVNLHKTMEYDAEGKPLIRVRVDGAITVDELNVDNVEITNDEGNPIPVNGTVDANILGGTISVDSIPEVEIKNDIGNPISVIGTTLNAQGHPELRVNDGAELTSKNRRKVSNYEIIDYCSYQYNKRDDVWDEETVNGSSELDGLKAMAKLVVGSVTGDKVVRQTKRVMRYIPGRPNEASMAVIFGTARADIRKRVGVFDAANGAFLENDGTDYNVVIRRTTTNGVEETRIERANWNRDKLDGTGPSGITIDFEKIQLVVIDYEWYGAGHVEFKFTIGHQTIVAHEFEHANTIDYTWASSAFLPLRVELENTGSNFLGQHTLFHGSHSVLAEGQLGTQGVEHNIHSTVAGYTLGNAGDFSPVVSIRLKSDRLNGVVNLKEFSASTFDNTTGPRDIIYEIRKNATITGGTWSTQGTESHVEYNIDAANMTGGEIVRSGYISNQNLGSTISFLDGVLTQIERSTTTTLADTSDIYTLAITSPSHDSRDVFGSLSWVEIR